MLRTLVLVLTLGACSIASAQVEATQDEHRAYLGVLTGVTAASSVWVTTIPWRGFWHDSPSPSDWRSWVSALAVGAAAGITTAFASPQAYDAVFVQAMVLSMSFVVEVPVLMVRALMSLGADACNEVCHKLLVALPLFVGLTASFIAGQVYDAELGPPSMTAPLVIAF